MPLWTAGAIVGSSLIGADAARSAGNTQADAANRAADLQYKMFQEQQATQAPFRAAGETALNKLIPEATNYKPFSYNAMTADPGYQFRLSEGMKALGHKAGAGGGLVSGQSLKGLQDYAQNSASNEYTNAFNRYQAERQARLGPLQSLAGVGQTAANTIGANAGTYGTNVGNLMTSGAAAQAAGGMGQAQAIGSGLGTYLNYNQGNNLVDVLRRNQPQFQPGSNAFVGPMPQYNPTPPPVDFTYGYGQT
jgi:hypothetical protein